MAGGSPRVYDLSAARPDGWFEQVLEQSKDFEKAAELIGRSTLGLALIAGARATSALRFASLPSARRRSIRPLTNVAMPAES